MTITRLKALSLPFALVALCTTAAAQTSNRCATSNDVGCTIPNLFGRGTTGITLASGFHAGHFVDAQRFSAQFLPLNTAIATQLTLLPLPSPASGYTYDLDPASGLRTPRAQTLGPILTERGETIGAKKVFVGFAYQRFRFSEVDGNDLGTLPVVFTHELGFNRPFERDVITTSNDLDLKIDQFTFYSTVGITNRFDVSVAVPILDVRMRGISTATIRPIGNDLCGPPGAPQTDPCHLFANGQLTTQFASPSGSATGLGDVILRAKGSIYDGERAAIAVAMDLRLPSGREEDFLGSGALGIRPFVALSLKGRVAPHVNFGYQWNGKSVLGGDITTGTEGDLPNQIFYSVGSDISVFRDLTIALDILGQRVFDAYRVRQVGHASGFQSLLFVPNSSFGIHNGGVGLKYNIAGRLLFTGNLLMSIDNGGLRQRVTPLIGLAYSF
jgi:hypothetical protein